MDSRSGIQAPHLIAAFVAGAGSVALVQKFLKYKPPKVWEAPQGEKAKKFGSNRPTAGAQFEKELPRGEHAIQLYSKGTPNGVKVTILLEELIEADPSLLDYDAWKIDIDGAQFGSGFVGVNPNSKVPAMLHYRDGPDKAPTRIFESASIMLYICEHIDKESRFIPTDPSKKAECMSWLVWLQSSAPYLGGGFGHFYNYAKEKIEYAIDRFSMETCRQLDVLNRHLGGLDCKDASGKQQPEPYNGCSGGPFLCGEQYTIADMAIFTWYGNLVLGRLYGAKNFLDSDRYTHVVAWAQRVFARPGVQRGRMVNRTWGTKAEQLHERHSAEDFKTKTVEALEKAAAGEANK